MKFDVVNRRGLGPKSVKFMEFYGSDVLKRFIFGLKNRREQILIQIFSFPFTFIGLNIDVLRMGPI